MAVLLAIITFVIVASVLVLPFMIGGGGRRQKIIRKRLESVEKAMNRDNSSL